MCLLVIGYRRLVQAAFWTRYAAARSLGFRVRIPPGAWMSVSCERRGLIGRGLYHGPITYPEQFHRVWCV